MSIQYGPINIFTTMFTHIKSNQLGFQGYDTTKKAKSIIRFDVPHKMQYTQHINKSWHILNLRKKKSQPFKKCRPPNKVSILPSKYKRRRDAIKNATPCWVTKEHISKINKLKKIVKSLNLTYKADKIQFSLDHIIPLRGERVCGLHIIDNLQILPNSANLHKGNNFEID